MRHCMSLIGVTRAGCWFLVELVRGVGLVFGVLAARTEGGWWMGGGGEGQIHPEMKLIGFTFPSFRDNIFLIRDEPADCGS